MKSFGEYLKMHRGSFFFAMAVTIAFSIWVVSKDVPAPLLNSFVVMTTVINLTFFFGRAFNSYTIDRNAIDERDRWQTSMLRALQLANASDAYYTGNANTLSAFHAEVHRIEQEGIKKGYLDIGRL